MTPTVGSEGTATSTGMLEQRLAGADVTSAAGLNRAAPSNGMIRCDPSLSQRWGGDVCSELCLQLMRTRRSNNDVADCAGRTSWCMSPAFVNAGLFKTKFRVECHVEGKWVTCNFLIITVLQWSVFCRGMVMSRIFHSCLHHVHGSVCDGWGSASATLFFPESERAELARYCRLL